MSYVALYRQWRPQDFENLVGQDHISTTIKNAITSGKIAHAFLFAGPRGTGKTSTAKILAKALNCVHGPTPTPCNECSNCKRITDGSFMDVFEIDAASNRGIDEIRELRENVKFAPVEGKRKVYIIDEVHMLTTEAFNALLKTLEEPPAHAVFVLATTEPHKIPATIHSRCQRYDFRRISVREIEARLMEVANKTGLKISPEALRLVAVQADGGMRDALSILDQCATLEETEISVDGVRRLVGLIGHEWVWKISEAMGKREAPAMLTALDELVTMGKDMRQFLLETVMHFRDLLIYKAVPDMGESELCSTDSSVLKSQSALFTHEEITGVINTLNNAITELRWSPDPRITTEMALLNICNRADAADIKTLTERIAALEAKLAGIASSDGRPAVQPRPLHPTTVAVPVPVSQAYQPKRPLAAPTISDNEPVSSEPAHSEVSGDLKEIWDKVLKDLVDTGKRSVHACVSNGKLVSLTEREAVIQFSMNFSRERTEKPDYKSILEKIIHQISGKTVTIKCITTADPIPVQSARRASPSPVPVENDLPDVVKKAQQMFGGKVVEQKD